MSPPNVRAALLPALFSALLSACAVDGPSSTSAGDSFLERYDRSFTFVAPVPVTIFVRHRVLDYAGHQAEYGVRIGDRELTAVYLVDPRAALPLVVSIYDDRTGALLLETHGDDTLLEVSDDDGVVLKVGAYTLPGETVTMDHAPRAIDPDALTLLRACLPARVELGRVPSFFLNRADQSQPDANGITSSTSSERALLDVWDAPVTLLGAYTLAGVCLGGANTAAYGCPCFSWTDGPAGEVDGGTCRKVVNGAAR